MDNLRFLENQSIYIIREAYAKYKDIALLLSFGKDSMTLLWLIRKAFFGKIPFPVIHIDTGYKIPEIYDFRTKIVTDLGLDLIVHRNEEAIANGMNPKTFPKYECCGKLKTEALKQALAKHHLRAVFVGIRHNEHSIRSKERFFSPRRKDFSWNYKDQPAELWNMFQVSSDDQDHVRIHPILSWSEVDIWEYIRQEGIPIPSLYLAKNGKRYRSIGCAPCCQAVDSAADTVDKIIEELKTTKVSERSGRSQDKEDSYNMQKLRSLGYM